MSKLILLLQLCCCLAFPISIKVESHFYFLLFGTRVSFQNKHREEMRKRRKEALKRWHTPINVYNVHDFQIVLLKECEKLSLSATNLGF